MKTIEVSDQDYETLMELSKELQTQENDSQAFPYFWSPRSTEYVTGTEDDEKAFCLDGEWYDAEEIFNCNDDLAQKFLDDNDLNEVYLGCKTSYGDLSYEVEAEWEEFLIKNGYYKWYRKKEKIQENNFSLFKSDVKDFIKYNGHHLGEKPHTYANTIFRMPRMEKIIKCLYRLNPQAKEDSNPEAYCNTNEGGLSET